MKLSVKLCAVLFAKKSIPQRNPCPNAVSYNPLVTSYRTRRSKITKMAVVILPTNTGNLRGKLLQIPTPESH